MTNEQDEEWLKDWHYRQGILAMALHCGATEFGPNTWNLSFSSEAWTTFLTMLRTPQESADG